ncbi:crosslink repair DNA glycosylase YcaQ family protein [Paucibacter sp. R3-3]|uniref:Crosslink repair DNA glycosylase YcaQ family protein n=2 Tax=Roseateles agri TaxID=3098619 RepID=A0ABU5DCM5_9BURK|nr:crosslink repair DNA glycosylase YcaQ family protein [Paucibacter sp. R3-3]MDY0743536.1 crosslink repair DNA glycosylase YcaQ family protein [Paucibacter sp. R3-3]
MPTMKAASPTLDELRRYAIARSLFKPTTLPRAIAKLGFVQADPMRAPARAQDLILRHRVTNYRAGELEQRYARLKIEEDCFVNYGFVPRDWLPLLHPRTPRKTWDAATHERAQALLAAVRERGPTHPKSLLDEFAHHGRMPGYWGGELNVSTQLLDGLHYRGHLRVKRRDQGTRIYEAISHPEQDQSDAARLERATLLLDRVVALYAPLPSASLGYLTSLLGYGVPHLRAEARHAFSKAARTRYAHAIVDGQTWYWPADENPRSKRHAPDERLRLLAPFDPVVWDRRRFETLWGWEYKFEAYVPAEKRRMGHYALPLLWGEEMLGWANLRLDKGRLKHELGFIGARPKGAAFKLALAEELERMRLFLGCE